MICLGYFSSASQPIDDDGLKAILLESQRNNHDQGVTGLLCHHEGSFLQFLEGEEPAVLRTFDRIGRDRRHKGVLEICRRAIDDRAFGRWSMGVVHPQRMGTAEQAFCTGLKDVEIAAGASHRDAIEPFIETFRAWLR